MDIFIKSFNRPYYLERCLRSVFQLITGNFKVTILDDGTPPVYLTKISTLFPKVIIRRSDQYTEKVSALNAHANGTATFSLTGIPTNFWRAAISESSSVFLLLEEDAWLTESIDVDNIETVMKECGLVTVKIGWNGSPLLVEGQKVRLTDSVEQLIPPTSSVPGIIERVLLTNTFKIRSVLQRLSLVNSLFTLPYYSRYTITSAFFDKQYWLWIWENAGDRINEGEQLYRSVAYSKLNATKYGKTFGEKVRTSFITSSVNRLKTVQFDMLTLHHQLNEAWLHGRLDAWQNFPRDFSVDYLKSFLAGEHPESNAAAWDAWIDEFKGLYRKAGCIVD